MAKIVRKIEAAAPAPVKLKRVAAYARVSMETERLNHSLSAQVSYYSELIQKHPGWVYAGVYADDDTLACMPMTASPVPRSTGRSFRKCWLNARQATSKSYQANGYKHMIVNTGLNPMKSGI